jgi:hypothetical protein
VPHEDKLIMEDDLISSGESFTIVRASLMVSEEETTKEVRVGIEDPKTGRESAAIGYTITKGDAGRWIAENLVLKKQEKYHKKIASKYFLFNHLLPLGVTGSAPLPFIQSIFQKAPCTLVLAV